MNFNSLRIKVIKMTFFDRKEVIYVKKIAKCKKCAKLCLKMFQV